MRLIDADALIEQLKEADRNFPNDIIKCCMGLVQTQPTAYDVEAVVAELEKLKEKPSGCNGIWCNECKYTGDCYEGEQGYKVALDRAIEIVRGKE